MRQAVRTSWGWIGMAAGKRGLLAVSLPAATRKEALAGMINRLGGEESPAFELADLGHDLKAFLGGEAVDLASYPVDWEAMRPFQRQVLAFVRQIPRGGVLSYGEVARAIGKPQAARAVGQALRSNPVPLVIPCHRVIAAGGRMGGFDGGTGAEDVDLKRRLLNLERLTASAAGSLLFP